MSSSASELRRFRAPRLEWLRKTPVALGAGRDGYHATARTILFLLGLLCLMNDAAEARVLARRETNPVEASGSAYTEIIGAQIEDTFDPVNFMRGCGTLAAAVAVMRSVRRRGAGAIEGGDNIESERPPEHRYECKPRVAILIPLDPPTKTTIALALEQPRTESSPDPIRRADRTPSTDICGGETRCCASDAPGR